MYSDRIGNLHVGLCQQLERAVSRHLLICIGGRGGAALAGDEGLDTAQPSPDKGNPPPESTKSAVVDAHRPAPNHFQVEYVGPYDDEDGEERLDGGNALDEVCGHDHRLHYQAHPVDYEALSACAGPGLGWVGLG